MITAGEIIKDLEEVKKKVEFAEITYPNNHIWVELNDRLENTILLLKCDMKIFGYGKK
jgi:hypothetical protein